MKSEPETYSIDQLKTDGVTPWEGVRNYQARNHMKAMRKGDLVLFYHSSCDPAGVAGLGVIRAEAHPDESQFQRGGLYFDTKATREKPIWYCVDVAFRKKAKRFVPLSEMRADTELTSMVVLQRGSRLSVQLVSEAHFSHICRLAGL